MPRGKSETTAEVWRDRVVRWKQSGLTPWAYLRDLLWLVSDWPASRLLELAPKHWRETMFRAYIDRYKTDAQADNPQYWIGARYQLPGREPPGHRAGGAAQGDRELQSFRGGDAVGTRRCAIWPRRSID